LMQVFTRPEHGSTFRVLFPAANKREGVSFQEKPAAHRFRGQGTVLVIDDEQIVRNLAKAALQQYGYSVILAENGQEGVDLFRRNADRVECIVLDATMPVMSGEETLLMLQELQRDVPVILSSGLGEAEIKRRFEGKGVAAFVQKPYRSIALLDKVTSVVSRKSSSN
jgi:two-component system cell cycle sensor histidine kinase/response regulator CckA